MHTNPKDTGIDRVGSDVCVPCLDPVIIVQPEGTSARGPCCLRTRVDNINKFGLQGGPAHKEAIHIWLGGQLLAVAPGNRT